MTKELASGCIQADSLPANAHPTLHWADIAGQAARSSSIWDIKAELHFFMKGRGAAFQALTSLRDSRGGEVLLPAFHCPSVVEPVLRAGYQPRFYSINRDLSIDVSSLEAQVSQKTAAIVVVNYCGFPAGPEVLSRIRDASNCCIIEDWAHSFLQSAPLRLAGSTGDVVLYSFSKLLPTYLGGGLLIKNLDMLKGLQPQRKMCVSESLRVLKRLAEEVVENARDTPIRAALLGLERLRVSLRKMKGDGLSKGLGGERSPLESPDHFFQTRMPWFANFILGKCDLDVMAARRRRNYAIVDKILVETDQVKKVFPCLPDDVCPWAFPLLVEGRGEYDQVLRSQGVPVYTFGETLHPCLFQAEPPIQENAIYLSESLLLLPIHQCLTAGTVVSFAEKVNALFRPRRGSGKMSFCV